jgi:hypothetical protein
MRTIEVDDEVYAYLQSKALPYIETTPNLTLRRLFNLNGKTSSGGISKGQMLQSEDKMGKKPKANLQTLIKSGLLQEGQTLYLYDYRGRRIEGYEAIVSGNSLLRNGKPDSMSELAKKGLKEKGFTSEAVRGPAHWYNSDGISVKELWSHFLNK